MGLNRSRGNMYEWVSHTWSAISGCAYQCSYCYVKNFKPHPPQMSIELPLPKLYGKWLDGSGNWQMWKTIFVAHCSDLFAADEITVTTILNHCKAFHKNTYMFQTRNTKRVIDFLPLIPVGSIIGTTIETNRRTDDISGAPSTQFRANWLAAIPKPDYKTFATIEPIMDFDLLPLVFLIKLAKPDFVNIGADSKGHNLSEPSPEKVLELIEALKKEGIEIREKTNLKRILSLTKPQGEKQ